MNISPSDTPTISTFVEHRAGELIRAPSKSRAVNERVLYLSYDGMLEPLGQSQVIAYLEKLAPGREIHLLSFEKPKDWADAELRSLIASRIADAGITWHPRVWCNRPRILAAVYNVLVGLMAALSIAIRHRISLFHARNILCSAMA